MDKALPFKEMIKNAGGDKQVGLEAAKMKDQWRRCVSLILLQENSYTLSDLKVVPLAAGISADVAYPPAGWTSPRRWRTGNRVTKG